ncbi:DUF4112 domain-containing protein [Acuticoccus sp. MNP-M23]|uniref:DUF4112 domain-containing protein n=1 Tax=Acuticoccus sp. MNP-M23 TaxID=3072793 RepID=UPI0028162C6A|nr:DUF4112 domain-containing protein [Acuticoccus sp. MNP-M23]WMS44034.1 DUF4112 domain-containing protein [Acuticoccus sp. MNP-M23]
MAPTLTMPRSSGSHRKAEEAPPSTEQLDKLAHMLDSRFSLFGIRFGVDSMLGLVPGIGDLAGLGMSAYILGQGYKMGARKRTLARMGVNVMGDTVFGAIPVLGTVIDVFWKSNRSNMRLLHRDIERGKMKRRF